ncbi:alpha/beta hydrolase [Paenibacillus sp. PL91]|uniref:alpha/beta hydrolase n=1 Tax=Paenibacillus sp. PL91 TaxID=2729538 RepID=UPI001CB976DB|nr:alpha/beta fold hydrolase [Paenibacillus sp. PL91]
MVDHSLKDTNQFVGSSTAMKQTSILWLSGWSVPNTVFDRFHAYLPEFNHITVDYSKADLPEEMLELAESAAKASESPLLIAGWSLGALLALRLASKGYANGLMLLGGTARFTRSKEEKSRGWSDAYMRQMIRNLQNDRNEVEAKFRQIMFTDAEREAGLPVRLPSLGSWSTSALIAGLQLLRNEECLSLLSQMACPALIIHGTEDKVCPYGAAEELMSLMPSAKLLTLTGCGHAPFIGREAGIAGELRRWWHEQ